MKNLIETIKKKLGSDKKSFGGFFIGEKVVFLAKFKQFVCLCNDFVAASKLKRGLDAVGKKVEIISCGRETDDAFDENLFPFAKAIQAFFKGQLDGLIFLPSSLSTKFDLKFLLQEEVFCVGQEISIQHLYEKLSNFGYQRVDYVQLPGQFAVRGDIVDVFAGQHPTRIEFFDEEIERIVNFDFADMKTLQSLQQFQVCPLYLKDGADNVLNLCNNVVVDQPERVINECAILKKEGNYFDLQSANLEDCYVFSLNLLNDYENSTIGQKSYVTDFVALEKDINAYALSGLDIYLFAGEFSKILQEFLTTRNIPYDFGEGKAKTHVLNEYFPYSFSFLNAHVVAIGTDDMYKARRTVFASGKQNFAYLPKIGDFVVHSFYGIGRCKDIVRMKLSSFEKDYFVLEYKNGALVYLPSEQANLISAYIGAENPKLNALGSAEWTRIKQKVKQDLKEIAITLAKIYKERQEKKGFCFARDDQLEKEFSDAFEFVLTPDQEKAIADVDADMESNRIMERLICGDVGFGKTEVAFRAIFKAAYNSKQVAFLCPTTILSEQHFRSATARLSPFGVKVEVLNRFKTQKQTDEILQKLKDGKIDVLIGTHKILNEKVQFKDLGLLVLDEEQRFGVKDKEKIKKFKTDVDVLTLSATPIPRTLHMSLSGIRDISVIATPPKDRLPIQTYVSSYSDELLQNVIQRELSRAGKALVLFNRVSDIYSFAHHLSLLVPTARIGVAHGQMEEKELASVIKRLYDNQFDVLVSTTLIENGIDLPALNTLFVVDCDKLGLSQLYQIRGRIGRGDKLAYAYLCYDGGKVLTEDAYKRLEAIKEFRELGSGFKIAMRDLEIRGAGNILGKEQHGHMQKVGYDMYTKLLQEVTRELSGQETSVQKEIKMQLAVDAFISQDYITSQEERIVFYDKISKISTRAQLEDILCQLQQLGGQVPKQTQNLCEVAYLKNLASNFNVKTITINSKECSVQLYKSQDIVDKRLSKIISFYDACLKFDQFAMIKINSNQKTTEKIKLLTQIFERSLQESL